MTITRREMLRLSGGAALVGALPLPVLAAPVKAKGVRVLTGPAFGSAWRLVMPDMAEDPRDRIEAIVRRVDARMSTYRRDSELARFNAAENGAESATVSEETLSVVEAALRLARESGGAFDPTSAPLGRRYGFGPQAISPASPAGRFEDIRIDGHVLKKAASGLTLDLNAIAKGHALDQMVAALDGLDFLIELGGEVAARGKHPSGRPWRIGVERPGSDKLQRMIDADENALATSGDGVQGYRVGGRRYAHVMDPRTGAPVNNKVASVSVLASSGLLADGLATAAMVLGPEASRYLLAAHDARALFLVRTAQGLEEVDVLGFVSGAKS